MPKIGRTSYFYVKSNLNILVASVSGYVLFPENCPFHFPSVK